MALVDPVSLALFTRVATTRSITKAAELSHIALAAASRRLTLLEQQLGVQLLERTARGVELTPAGRAALYHAQQILGQINQMVAEVSDYAKGSKGHVRLQASPSAVGQFLADDLAAFGAVAPQVAIALEERASAAIAQALRDGTTDVGVVMEGAPLDGLQLFDYNVDRLVALVPRDHAIRDRQVAFERLLPFDFVSLESETVVARVLMDQSAAAQKPLRIRVQVRSFPGLCKMVGAGLGIGVLPEGDARPLVSAMKLRIVQLTDDWAVRHLYVCVREYQTLPSAARKLVDHLTKGRAR